MKITGVDVRAFETHIDRHGFGEAHPHHRVVQTVTIVRTDEGAEGFASGVIFMGTNPAYCRGIRPC
jgi:hypothetical protein